MDPARTDASWQLVFNGECLAGHDPQLVRRALAAALKLDEERAARLFSGKRVVLRRVVDEAAARRHIARFARMGALLHAEPSKPRPQRDEPVQTRARPPGRVGDDWRQPMLWAGVGALSLAVGLVLGPGLGALWPETPARGVAVRTGPATGDAPAAMVERPTLGPVPAQAADEAPQDMTPDALRDYQQNYLRAAGHKAFAIVSGGAHAWHAGAASENEASEQALAGCMAARRPSDVGCRIVDLDGTWQE